MVSTKTAVEHHPFPTDQRGAIRWAIAKSRLVPIPIPAQQALIVALNSVNSHDNGWVRDEMFDMGRHLLGENQGRDTCEMLVRVFPGTSLAQEAEGILRDILRALKDDED